MPRSSLLDAYESARSYREDYAWKTEPSYELACDFANAWKHRSISRTGRTFSGMNDVREAYAICRYNDEQGYYARGHKVVMIKTSDGRLAELRRVLVASTIFWSEELLRLGAIPTVPEGIFDFGEFSSRTDAHAQRPLVFHGIVGEYLSYHAQRFDFDPATRGWIDPLPGWGEVEIPMEFEIRNSPFPPPSDV
jgi:hypothetical protein